MQWLHENSDICVENIETLCFKPRASKILQLRREGEAMTAESTTVITDNDWEGWIEEHSDSNCGLKNGINLVLAGRAEISYVEPMLLSYLPFSKLVFNRILKHFFVHGSIVRDINRNTNCTFSRQYFQWISSREASIVYNCRSPATWPRDLAMSATFVPSRNFTYAVFYGCADDMIDDITKKLSYSGSSVLHPLVLPTIFAEIERNRQIGIAEDSLTKLVQRVLDIGHNSEYGISGKEKAADLGSLDSITLWLEISEIKNGLENWKKQLLKMIGHADELADNWFRGRGEGKVGCDVSMAVKEGPDLSCGIDEDDRIRMLRSGTRIKERLRELVDEYEERIRDCVTTLDGMALATQLEWNNVGRQDYQTNMKISQSNLEIASTAKRDGSQMKSIAVMTMIFLPGTFVATVFSMSFFDWHLANDTNVLSPYIWIYLALTAFLTVATLGAWYYFTHFRTPKEDGKQEAPNTWV